MIRRTVFGLTLVLGLAGVALAQNNPEDALVDGKRVWITYPGKGWLVPAGKIVGKNADGTYKVAVYEFNLDDTTRSPARPQDVEFTGNPIRTIDVPAAELTRWNTTKFDTWVEKDGKPWPKAKLVEDLGDKVVVDVYDTNGQNVEKQVTITKGQQGGEALKRFRALNALTAPDPSLTTQIGDNTQALIDEANRELRKNGFKLPNGEDYPKIHSLPDMVSELRTIAERYKPLIERETNVNKIASLQEEMLRELYTKAEELAQIKHGGRPTTSADWKRFGSDLQSKARATGDQRTPGQSLQETLLGRAISCFEKSKVFWQLLNLADVPALTGVGFRLLSWGFHGTLGAKLSDGSWREWETTEGFDAPLVRLNRFEVKFDGPGDSGNGLGHSKNGLDPMTVSGEIAAPIGAKLDRSKAKVWLDLSWKGQPDTENKAIEVNVATGDVKVFYKEKDASGNLVDKTAEGKATPEELAALQKAMNGTDLARIGDAATPEGRGPHFTFTGSDFVKSSGDTQAFGGGSPFRDFVLMSQTIGRRLAWDAGSRWGGRASSDPVDPAAADGSTTMTGTTSGSSSRVRTGAELARERAGIDRGPSNTTGLDGILDDRIRTDGKATVDPVDGGR